MCAPDQRRVASRVSVGLSSHAHPHMCSLAEAYTGTCFSTPSPAGGGAMMGGGPPMPGGMGPPPMGVAPYMSPQAPVQAMQPMPQPVSPCDKTRYHCSQCPDCQGFFTSILNGAANPKNGSARPMMGASGGGGGSGGGSGLSGVWDWMKEHDKTVIIGVLAALLLLVLWKQWRAKRAMAGMGGTRYNY